MRRALLLTALLGLTALSWGQSGAPSQLNISFSPHGSLSWSRGSRPALLVTPLPGDGWLSMARRLSGTTAEAGRLRQSNPRLQQPMRDQPVRYPLTLLRADLRLAAVQRLFPVDQRVPEGWQHWVLDPFNDGGESWEWLAHLFAGHVAHAEAIRRANPDLAASQPQRGRTVLIPERLLLQVFRDIVPVTPTATPVPTRTPTAAVMPTRAATARSLPTWTPVAAVPTPPGNGPLSYGRDSIGDHAIYRLREGEALYSAVVVRFTGQLAAVQVNQTAAEIARRSGIRDVTSIPIGYPIRISFDLLLPEFLPPGHARRLQWEAEQRELADFAEVVRAADLSGIHVILDAGHGGIDTGAEVGGVWEATYTYDIMCRVKSQLERHTRAKVWPTIKDHSRGFVIPNRDRLRQDRDQSLLTRPPFDLASYSQGERQVPIHLRWYLGNDIIRQQIKGGAQQSKMVFLSIHADSLHASVRGAMVYVPSRHMRPDSYSVKHRSIRRYQEYRNHPDLQLSSRFKSRAEASSRHLAKQILKAIGESDLAVHPYKPIRDRVMHGRRSYVPAVLRYSMAQHAVLVECCNMGNAADRKNLRSQVWREQLARSIVAGLAAAFAGETH
jgi:N-acetylmuramoyl-L-alanine amidase